MGAYHWPLYHCRGGIYGSLPLALIPLQGGYIWELTTGPYTTVGVVYMGAYHWSLYHCRGGIYGSLPLVLIPL